MKEIKLPPGSGIKSILFFNPEQNEALINIINEAADREKLKTELSIIAPDLDVDALEKSLIEIALKIGASFNFVNSGLEEKKRQILSGGSE